MEKERKRKKKRKKRFNMIGKRMHSQTVLETKKMKKSAKFMKMILILTKKKTCNFLKKLNSDQVFLEELFSYSLLSFFFQCLLVLKSSLQTIRIGQSNPIPCGLSSLASFAELSSMFHLPLNCSKA